MRTHGPPAGPLPGGGPLAPSECSLQGRPRPFLCGEQVLPGLGGGWSPRTPGSGAAELGASRAARSTCAELPGLVLGRTADHAHSTACRETRADRGRRATASRGWCLLKTHPGFPCNWSARPWHSPSREEEGAQASARALGGRRQGTGRPAPPEGLPDRRGAQTCPLTDHSWREGPAPAGLYDVPSRKTDVSLSKRLPGGPWRPGYCRVTAF